MRISIVFGDDSEDNDGGNDDEQTDWIDLRLARPAFQMARKAMPMERKS